MTPPNRLSGQSPIWHPFTQHALQPEMTAIASAEGAWLQTADGRGLFDAISSWWVVTHGHRHPVIMEAIRQQTERLDQVIFAGFTHEPAEHLARGLIDIAPPGLSRVFFSDSGSTAVEVAIKMALGYWRQVDARRTRIIALEHAYHGDTVGTMSAGARGIFTASYAPLLYDVVRIPFPAAGHEQATFDALEAACRCADAAAFLFEPLILGAGGMLMYPADVLATMHAIARQHGVLTIADEVMTGFGRTGTLFALEQANINPDILCIAKGLTGGVLPLAATLCAEPIFEAHYAPDRARMFFHSSSYTANPLACAAAVANLGVWQNEPVRGRIKAVAEIQNKNLAALNGDARFVNARQLGTIAAFDLAGCAQGYLATAGLDVQKRCLERGVLIRPLGNTIYVMPPYCSTEADLKLVYDAIRDAAHPIR